MSNKAGMFAGFGEPKIKHRYDMFGQNAGEHVGIPSCQPFLSEKKGPTARAPWMEYDQNTGVRIINWYFGESVNITFKVNGKIWVPAEGKYFELASFLRNKFVEIRLLDFESHVLYNRVYTDLKDNRILFNLNPRQSQQLRKGIYRVQMRIYTKDNFEDLFESFQPGFIDHEGKFQNPDEHNENSITTNRFPVTKGETYFIVGTNKVPVWSKFNADLSDPDGPRNNFLGQDNLTEYFAIEDSDMQITFMQGLVDQEKHNFKILTQVRDGDPIMDKVVVSEHMMKVVVH